MCFTYVFLTYIICPETDIGGFEIKQDIGCTFSKTDIECTFFQKRTLYVRFFLCIDSWMDSSKHFLDSKSSFVLIQGSKMICVMLELKKFACGANSSLGSTCNVTCTNPCVWKTYNNCPENGHWIRTSRKTLKKRMVLHTRGCHLNAFFLGDEYNYLVFWTNRTQETSVDLPHLDGEVTK